MVLDDDYLEAVSEHFALNDLLQFCPLAPCLHRSERAYEKSKSSAATQDTFSFGHVRF